MIRLFWLTLGVGALVLAILGIVLPLLPTTPFLLVSVFAFARSSPKLHTWLVSHPQLGPPIHEWHREGAIDRRTKIVAVLVMMAAFGLSLALGVSTTVLIIQALVLSAAAAFVISRPVPSSRRDVEKKVLCKNGE